jgi:GNAT superfamily N-acetyltransferase
MQSVAIRSALPRDIDRIIELLDRGALADRKEDPSDEMTYLTALFEIQAMDGSDVLVAVTNGEVVGVCQLLVFRHIQHRGGVCGELESMHVHPDFRGKGIGTLLLAAVEKAAKDAGCYRLQLTSNLERTDAHRFYERHGFTNSHIGFKKLLSPE